MSTIIRTRSPFFIRTPNETSADLSYFNIVIKIYNNDFTAAACGDESDTITLNKKPLTGDNSVTIEICEIINEYIEQDFTNYTSAGRSGSKWVKLSTQAKESDGTSIGSVTNTYYLAQEGYNEFLNGVNYTAAQNLMITSDFIQYDKNSTWYLPVNSETVNSVQFRINNTTMGTSTVSDSDSSFNKIQYLTWPTGNSEIQELIITYNTTQTRTVKVQRIDECKYPVNKISFLNKWGAIQDLYFFKKSTESLETQSENFNRSIFQAKRVSFAIGFPSGTCDPTNHYNEYDIKKHSNKTFNANGTETLQLNTGFVSESMNDSFRELMVSEYVWLTDSLSNVLPVTLKDSSLTYKTGLNDKMINYTMSFEKSFKLINNVR